MASEPPRQMALALRHAESHGRDDFLVGAANADAIAIIDRWPDWPHRVMALVGPEGAGKSHMTAIWAERSGARRIAAPLLTRENVPEALEAGALAVEDLAAEGFDPAALFHLLNHAREQNAFVLMTMRTPPAEWQGTLPDLVSRLRAIPRVAVMPPDDDLIRALMVKLCADRQIVIDAATVAYLTARIERSYAAVRATVARLDEVSLERKRPITRALAADILMAMPSAEEGGVIEPS